MSTETKVGAFVIAAIALVVGAIYFVQSTHTVQGQVTFKTYFRDAGGLEADGAVLFGGSRVGRITAVRPRADNPTMIEVLFDVTATTPMNQQSAAHVGTVSLMGSPALMITTGSNGAARLTSGAVVPSTEPTSVSDITRSVMAAADSASALMVDLHEELPALNAQMQAVLTNAQTMTGPRNQAQIHALLDELSALVEGADGVVASMRPVVSNIDHAATNVDQTVDAVRRPLVDDLTDLGRAIDEAHSLVADLRSTTEAHDADVDEALRALGTTADNLRAFSEVVKERPWSLIRTTQPDDRRVPR